MELFPTHKLTLAVRLHQGEPVSLALRHKAGKQKDLCLMSLQLSSLFKSCSLRTLSCDWVPHD